MPEVWNKTCCTADSIKDTTVCLPYFGLSQVIQLPFIVKSGEMILEKISVKSVFRKLSEILFLDINCNGEHSKKNQQDSKILGKTLTDDSRAI